MKHSIEVGLSFGFTSAIITTLGLMIGLEAGTSSRLAVIGGVLTIAIADACSDALGIHVSEESENRHSHTEIWVSTVTTFLAKAVFSSIFVIPVILLPLKTAIYVSVIVGMTLLALFSYFLARRSGVRPWPVVVEHLSVGLAVVVVTHFIGRWIGASFR